MKNASSPRRPPIFFLCTQLKTTTQPQFWIRSDVCMHAGFKQHSRCRRTPSKELTKITQVSSPIWTESNKNTHFTKSNPVTVSLHTPTGLTSTTGARPTRLILLQHVAQTRWVTMTRRDRFPPRSCAPAGTTVIGGRGRVRGVDGGCATGARVCTITVVALIQVVIITI